MAQAQFTFDKHIDNWTTNSKSGNGIYKGGNIAKKVLFWLTIAMVVVTLVVFVLAITKIVGAAVDAQFDELLSTFETYIKIVKILIIISCVLNILKGGWYIVDAISNMMFAKWLAANNVDALPELMSNIDTGLGRKAKRRFNKVAISASAKKEKSALVLQTVGSVLRFIAVIVTSVAIITYVGNTIMDNLINLLEASRGQASISLNIGDVLSGFMPFVIEVIIAAICSFVAWILLLVCTSSAKDWIRASALAVAPAPAAAPVAPADNSNGQNNQ